MISERAVVGIVKLSSIVGELKYAKKGRDRFFVPVETLPNRQAMEEMLKSAEAALLLVTKYDKEQIKSTAYLRVALERYVQSAGEMANRVSDEIINKLPDIKWDLIIPRRHNLVHQFYKDDFNTLVGMVTYVFPSLIRKLKKLLSDESDYGMGRNLTPEDKPKAPKTELSRLDRFTRVLQAVFHDNANYFREKYPVRYTADFIAYFMKVLQQNNWAIPEKIASSIELSAKAHGMNALDLPVVLVKTAQYSAEYFDAVTYDGAVYCTDCMPEGVDIDSEGVSPIFADSEWDSYPTCAACGEEHTYVNLTSWGVQQLLENILDEETDFNVGDTVEVRAYPGDTPTLGKIKKFRFHPNRDSYTLNNIEALIEFEDGKDYFELSNLTRPISFTPDTEDMYFEATSRYRRSRLRKLGRH